MDVLNGIHSMFEIFIYALDYLGNDDGCFRANL